MSKALKCAVIGTGYFGERHADKYSRIEHCELTAVVDSQADRASKVAAAYSTTPLTDHRELLGKIDAVSVVTSASSHYEIARDFLSYGTHVLVEKPMAETVEHADHLIELAERNQCVLQIGHIERFNPVLELCKTSQTDGGFIQLIRLSPFSERNNDVCAVLDMMIHDIDLALCLANSDINRVSSKGLSVLSNDIDIANARIEFANDCIADISVSRVSNKHERNLRIFVKNRYFSLRLGNNSGREFWKDESTGEIRHRHEDYPESDMLMDEIKHFIDCVRFQKPPLVGGIDGRRALAAALQIKQQIRQQI